MNVSLRLCRRLICAIVLSALCTGCVDIGVQHERSVETADTDAERMVQQGDMDGAAAAFLDLADAHPGERDHYRLRAAEVYREEGNLNGAAQALDGVRQRRLGAEEGIRYNLLDAQIALSGHDPARALQRLNYPDANLPMPLRQRTLELRARAQSATGDLLESARTRATLDRWLGGVDRMENETQLVATLQKLAPDALKQQAETLPAGDPLRPWLNQALHKNGQALPLVVMRPNQPVGTLIPGHGSEVREGYQAAHFVALLLPSAGALRAVAQAVRDGFLAAYFADTNPQRPQVRVYDSGDAPQQAVAAYQQAVADGADRVVGPLRRDAVSAVFAQGHMQVPLLALNQPEHGEVPPPGSAAFGLTPDAEAAQAAEHMIERGITHAVIVTATDDWAERASLAFRAQFESRNGEVLDDARVKDGEVNYSTIIQKAMARVPTTHSAAPLPGAAPSTDRGTIDPGFGVFISMRPQQARLLLPQLKLAGYTGIPVFATSHIYAVGLNPGMDRDLDGVEFCDAPWLFDAAIGLPKFSDISRVLDSSRGAGARLFALGMDAYALLPYLDWLSLHHDSYVPGATGQLAEDDLDRIQRLLIWARFDDGVARPINGGLQMSTAPQQ
jgi:outer membrane PBP1 activator LpoA protein